MRFKITENNQLIDLDPGSIDVAESSSYLTATFDFPSAWDGFTKLITFVDNSTGVVLQETLSSDTITEAMELVLAEGDWTIKIVGTLGSKTLQTIPIVKHADAPILIDDLPPDIADGLYAKLSALAGTGGGAMVGLSDGTTVEAKVATINSDLDAIEGAWQVWTPTLTWGIATPSNVVANCKYKIIGKTLFFDYNISATDGNNSDHVEIVLPYIITKTYRRAISNFFTVGASTTTVKFDFINNYITGYRTMTAGASLQIFGFGFYEIV